MSTCISRHGEWSDHILDDAYTCTRCLVLDEDALVAELRRARAELEAARPVVEAAAALVKADRAITVAEADEIRPAEDARDMAFDVLAWSVDLYRSATTRNLDSALPDPSLDAETLEHRYLSTACHHGLHDRCGGKQAERGDTGPPHCKHCPSVCRDQR